MNKLINGPCHNAPLFLSAVATLYLVLSAPASAVFRPGVPDYTLDDYTVTFACSVSTICWLEERAGSSGSWLWVTSASGGSLNGSHAYVNKPLGEYHYRAVEFFMVGPMSEWYQLASDALGGPEIAHVVSYIPSIDPIDTQLAYTYQVRYGDIDSDSDTDVFLKRVTGGESGNGALESIILKQGSGASFTTLVPSAAQITTASAWPIATNVELVIEDYNVDNFVDFLLKDLDTISGITGSDDQIVYSPGRLLTEEPREGLINRC